MADSTLQQQLAALRAQYLASLGNKRAALAAAWLAYSEAPADRSLLAPLILQTHSLAGSGSSFGCPEISVAARRAEDALRALVNGGDAPQAAQCVHDLLVTLQRYAQNAAAPQPPAPDEHAPAPQHEPGAKLVYLLMTEDGLREETMLQLRQFGFDARSYATADALVAAVDSHSPNAVIVDMDVAGGTAGLQAVRQRGGHTITSVVVAKHGDMPSRLAAVRAGADAYYTKPLDLNRLLDTLDVLTADQQAEPYRILIVDDAPDVAEYHALHLEAAGMVTRVVTDAMQVMQVIDEFSPELILLDVYMPDISGPELAEVVRLEDSYIGTPIVFLSRETDKDKQLLALSYGADDFLSKPITPSHLIAAVRSRAERYRILRSFMVRDSLTGLLNHTNLKERLDSEVARAERQHGPLSFAMVDLDHFKQVNDRYGHPTGDRVLKGLARLIRQRLRKTDIVGRYGGEEFAIILTDTDAQTARHILEDLRRAFAELRHRSDSEEFQVTFSAGIASHPACRDAIALSDAADKALYEAKHAGRNRIVVA